MLSPRIIMYAGLGLVAFNFLRQYLQRQKLAAAQPKIVEQGVVPGVDRKGDDALTRIVLTTAEAKAGKPMAVPSIDGVQQIEVPAGTKDGQKLRLAGLGFRRSDGTRGDQFVIVQVGG